MRKFEAEALLTPGATVTHHDLVAVGLTYRQIDHWSRRGYLRPVKAGLSVPAAEKVARGEAEIGLGITVAVGEAA